MKLAALSALSALPVDGVGGQAARLGDETRALPCSRHELVEGLLERVGVAEPAP